MTICVIISDRKEYKRIWNNLKPSTWGNGQKIPGRLARFSQIDYEIGPSARNLFPLPKWPKHQPPLSHGHLGDCCQTHKDQYGNRPGWVKGCFLRGRILKKNKCSPQHLKKWTGQPCWNACHSLWVKLEEPIWMSYILMFIVSCFP